MDAILTAGGIPQPGEPLYELTRGQSKAMLPVAGKPMIQWVLDALGGSQHVGTIVLTGLTEESGLTCAKPLIFIPNQGSLLENLAAGVDTLRRHDPAVRHVLGVSSDIPAITPQMVDWLIEAVQQSDHQLYYCVVPRAVMEARYPGSKRSFTRLKDAEVCGGDMNAFDATLMNTHNAMWNRLADSRKNVFKQAALIGFDTLLLLLVRQLTLDGAVRRVTQRLGIRGRALVSPFAELGMDVDKPHQFEMVAADLAGRVSALA